jgi:plasmid replication initiation protein
MPRRSNVSRAIPDRHPLMARRPRGSATISDDRQLDLFVALVGDVPLRDDREAMSLPMVSLGKRKRVTPIEWRSSDGNRWVRVSASPVHGMATIYDVDVLLWAVSQLNEAVEHGLPTAPTLNVSAYELLRAIHRGVSGQHYAELRAALNRLAGTLVETNIRATGRRRSVTFHWLEGWSEEVDEATGISRGMTITLPGWLYAAVVRERAVLAVAPSYFEMSSGIGRWLYRLARRHAGRQSSGWRFTMRELHSRSGSTQALAQFAQQVRRIVKADDLPDYRLSILRGQHGDEIVHMMRDPARAGLPQRRDLQRINLSED